MIRAAPIRVHGRVVRKVSVAMAVVVQPAAAAKAVVRGAVSPPAAKAVSRVNACIEPSI